MDRDALRVRPVGRIKSVRIRARRSRSPGRTKPGAESPVKPLSLLTTALLLTCVAFFQDSLAQDYTRWSLPEGAISRLGKGGNSPGERSVVFSPDGTLLAVGSSAGIWLYNAHTGAEAALFTGGGWVTSVTFSPDGGTLASGSVDQTVRLWDVSDGATTAILRGHTGTVYSVSFSPDGTTLATGSQDRTVQLWDVATGANIAIFQGHADEVLSVSFSPDGATIASGSIDRTVRLWDVSTGTNTATLEGHIGYVLSVSFSPDGGTVASGALDGSVRLWDVVHGNKHRPSLGAQGLCPFGVVFAGRGHCCFRCPGWHCASVGRRLGNCDYHSPRVQPCGPFSVVFS